MRLCCGQGWSAVAGAAAVGGLGVLLSLGAGTHLVGWIVCLVRRLVD